jgi:adenosylcobinamide-GDP ribazoletransferase
VRPAIDPSRTVPENASPIRAARLALSFLTILPVRFRDGEITPEDLAASRFAYPMIGGAIGLGLAALSVGLDRAGTPPAPSAFLLVAAGVAITGALHLDGLADTADGLFLGGDPERRLAVMRDPHVGSFGVVALVLAILGKWAALNSLGGSRRALSVLGAAVVGRSLILVAAGSASYARRDGTGRRLVEATTPRDALVAAALMLLLGPMLARVPGLVASGVALGLGWAFTRLATRRLGGLTGDILGALVELGELTFLMVLAVSGGA